MRVKVNRVETRSTKGMKVGVGESATMANPTERIGKTMLGCLVKMISLKATICVESPATEELCECCIHPLKFYKLRCLLRCTIMLRLRSRDSQELLRLGERVRVPLISLLDSVD